MTTTLDFDARSGRLRVDRASFEKLVAAQQLGPAAAGSATETTPQHLRARAGLDTVLHHLCEFHVTVATSNTIQAHDGWIGDTAAAVLLQRPEDVYDFITIDPQFVPALLARVVRLGPRKPAKDRGPASSPAELVDRLFDEAAPTRASAFGELALPGITWVWSVTLVWSTGSEETVTRQVVAADGAGGPYLLAAGDGDLTWTPVQARLLWLAFDELLFDAGSEAVQPVAGLDQLGKPLPTIG